VAARCRPVLLLVVLVVLAGVLAGVARAGAQVDATVQALRSAPLYSAPKAELGLSSADQSRVERAIAQDEPGPMYIAVLPDRARAETGGDTTELVRAIGTSLRRPGTYVVLAGRQLRAGSTLLPRGEAGRLAAKALEVHRGDGAAAVLADLVHRVAQARKGDSGGDSGGPGAGSGGSSALALLGLLAIGGGAFAFVRSRRRRRELATQMEELRRVARDDLVSLGDEVRAVDLDVEMPGAAPAAREDLGKALACYEEAERRFATARTPDDFGPVTSACEEGRYWMAAVRAQLAGSAPPERRAPCFFDPRHGPSTRDVEWSPDGGAARPVPACEADAVRIEAGRNPDAREIVVNGRSMPYWNAPGYFGPWAGGYYGGFGFGGVGGFLPGLLFGSMLGGGLGGGLLGAPLGWGAGDYDAGGGGGDFAGGGDFGGGFGGGDFGGGDFGGGGGDF
jgi:hypothetical protein